MISGLYDFSFIVAPTSFHKAYDCCTNVRTNVHITNAWHINSCNAHTYTNTMNYSLIMIITCIETQFITMHSNPQPQRFITHSITHNHTLEQLTNNSFICPKAIHSHHHIYHINSYLIIVHKLLITYPRLTVQSHINCTRFTQLKVNQTLRFRTPDII